MDEETPNRLPITRTLATVRKGGSTSFVVTISKELMQIHELKEGTIIYLEVLNYDKAIANGCIGAYADRKERKKWIDDNTINP